MQSATTFVGLLAAPRRRRLDSALCSGRPQLRARRARTGLLPMLPSMAVAQPLAPLMTAPEELREKFGAAVSGEFTGYEADFDADSGAALVVPNYYIPEEFSEMGLFPVGFEATNSVILRGSKLYQKHFRTLHNVTIFGDHVDVEEELRIIDTAEEAGFYAFLDGSFSSGPASVVVDRKSELEKWPSAELVLRNGPHAARAKFTFDFSKAELVKPVHATVEKFSCTWCDGGDLEGSSGYVEGWANDPPMDPSALDGDWNTGGAPASPRAQLYLPSGLDVGLVKAENGGCVLHVGWLVEPRQRVVLTRTYSADGKVVGSEKTEES